MKSLIFLLLNTCFLIPTIAAPMPGDSLRLVQTNARIDGLEARVQRLGRTNDSLNKELYYYRAKDDFYVMAVDRQGSHFEFLIGTALAIAGLLSYSYFRKELSKSRDEMEARLVLFEKEDAEMRNTINEAKVSMYRTFGFLTTQSTLSQLATGFDQQFIAFINKLEALVHYYRAYELASEEVRVKFIDEIDLALLNCSGNLDKMGPAPKTETGEDILSVVMNSQGKHLLNNLKKVSTIDNDAISNKAIKLIARITDLITKK